MLKFIINIKLSIPLYWRQLINNTDTFAIMPDYPVKINDMVKDITEVPSREFYWVLVEKSSKEPSCIKKWEEISDIDIDWPSTFLLPFKTISDTKLQSFQFRIVHRIIPCNGWLQQIREKIFRKENSGDCDYCGEFDDLVHHLIKCENTNKFWERFTNWLGNILEEELKITHHDIIFGQFGDSIYKHIINYCLIIAKYYIFITKNKKDNNIDMMIFLQMLKKNLLVKYNYACLNDTVDHFNFMWNILFENL